MGQFFGQLYAYASAVGGYWFAIIPWVAFMTGDGADWGGFRGWLDRAMPRQRRRPLEIAVMVGLVFFAGFRAWQDENAQRITADGRAIPQYPSGFLACSGEFQ
jgi:hypothetical protein